MLSISHGSHDTIWEFADKRLHASFELFFNFQLGSMPMCVQINLKIFRQFLKLNSIQISLKVFFFLIFFANWTHMCTHSTEKTPKEYILQNDRSSKFV